MILAVTHLEVCNRTHTFFLQCPAMQEHKVATQSLACS